MNKRVRYCDPELIRFIQLDANYSGEQEDVTSQNRYTYALNNPYKYEDRDGNKSLEANVDLNTDSKIKKLLEASKSIANNVVSTSEQAKSTTNKFIENVLNYVEKTMARKNGNTTININNKRRIWKRYME